MLWNFIKIIKNTLGMDINKIISQLSNEKINEKVLTLVKKLKHREMYKLYCENLIKEIFLIKSFLK